MLQTPLAVAVKILFCLFMLTLANAVQAGADKRYVFRVLLDDREIGAHSFHVVDGVQGEVVEIDARFRVTFFGIPVYSYAHQNREVWKDGCLVEIRSSTNDNGDQYSVQGQTADGKFRVTKEMLREELDAPCVMTFAYWNRDYLRQKRLLNSQTGDYLAVDVESAGTERLRFDQREVVAERYHLRNREREVAITVWYSETTGEWLSLESKVSGGRTIRYLPSGVGSMLRPGQGEATPGETDR